MRLSELIGVLKEKQAEHGDRLVFLSTGDDGYKPCKFVGVEAWRDIVPRKVVVLS
jgi:hypothetical protein